MEGAGLSHLVEQTVMPICITGMHRTGTSLVAGLLNRHGLWLGEEEDMMPANPFNPDGYFENERVVELNNTLLSLYGGGWDSPPDLAGPWTRDPRLEGAKARARAIGERLASGHPVWGFKDPRAALTLPFWRSVWGDLNVVFTVRNPLETAWSLNRRDGLSIARGIALWSAYYRSLLALTTPETRIVVDYGAFCANPVGSAAALLARLPGLRAADPTVARESVREPLRHHRATPADLQAHGVTADVLELYAELQKEVVNPTGEVATLGTEDALRAIGNALSSLDLAIRDVHVDLHRLSAVVDRLTNEIGFVRSADVAGLVAQLEYQGGLVERIAEALPQLGERVAATEAELGLPATGRRRG